MKKGVKATKSTAVGAIEDKPAAYGQQAPGRDRTPEDRDVAVAVASGTSRARRRQPVTEMAKPQVRNLPLTWGFVLERVTGIEPALSAWEADVLPLNYTRDTWRSDQQAGKSIADGWGPGHGGSGAPRPRRPGWPDFVHPVSTPARVPWTTGPTSTDAGCIEKGVWAVCAGGTWAVFHKGHAQDWAGPAISGRLERVAGGNIRRNVRMRSSPGPDKMVAGQLDEGVNGGNRHE
jgi:hypothetical protein